MFKPLMIAAAVLSLASGAGAQSAADDAAIRAAEQQMADALISGDTAVVARLLDPAFVVNSPANMVTDGAAMLGMVQSGFISYSAYEKATDRITFIGDLAVSMGTETVTSRPRGPTPGTTVRRRYTNVWQRGEGGWTLIVRQATNLTPPVS